MLWDDEQEEAESLATATASMEHPARPAQPGGSSITDDDFYKYLRKYDVGWKGRFDLMLHINPADYDMVCSSVPFSVCHWCPVPGKV